MENLNKYLITKYVITILFIGLFYYLSKTNSEYILLTFLLFFVVSTIFFFYGLNSFKIKNNSLIIEKTNLNEVLGYVRTQTDTYLQKHEGQNTKVLIIILGDGAIHDYKSAFVLKEELGNNPLIYFSSILFESPTWEDQYDANSINNVKKDFSKLASTDADYMSTVDPEKIRNHMIQSITKVSKI